jgi:Uma2 family endonuclease
MVATAIQQKITTQSSVNQLRTISWAEFQKKYLVREDNFKYEWVDGFVEKTTRTMDRKQFYIIENLTALLDLVKNKYKIDGRLIPEGDNFFSGNHRRPDVAYYTRDQIRLAQDDDNEVVPQFVIEVISTNDQMNKVVKKMKNYRAAEVPIIWHIFPNQNEIHIYKGKQMTICVGDDICSAEPVVKGFNISVNDVLKKL